MDNHFSESSDVNQLNQPIRKAMRTGMFSAQHGLFLAIFLASIMFIALIIKWLCSRYCPERCKNCSPKHEESLQSDFQIAPVHPPENSQQPIPELEPEHEEVTFRGRIRTSSTCAIPGMQTLYEEDESESPPESPNLERNIQTSVIRRNGVVYTIYTFPNSNISPELARNTVISRHSENPTSSSGLRDDLPPSYEDLFPIKSELPLPIEEIIRANRASKSKRPETKINMEP